MLTEPGAKPHLYPRLPCNSGPAAWPADMCESHSPGTALTSAHGSVPSSPNGSNSSIFSGPLRRPASCRSLPLFAVFVVFLCTTPGFDRAFVYRILRRVDDPHPDLPSRQPVLHHSYDGCLVLRYVIFMAGTSDPQSRHFGAARAQDRQLRQPVSGLCGRELAEQEVLQQAHKGNGGFRSEVVIGRQRPRAVLDIQLARGPRAGGASGWYPWFSQLTPSH
ncbi:hypothetical protein EI94DRAFT_1906651 [Lactarius quietus]|nr:hypothetical protein EI94DRAFT_1906651 [Lactarius quietus]